MKKIIALIALLFLWACGAKPAPTPQANPGRASPPDSYEEERSLRPQPTACYKGLAPRRGAVFRCPKSNE